MGNCLIVRKLGGGVLKNTTELLNVWNSRLSKGNNNSPVRTFNIPYDGILMYFECNHEDTENPSIQTFPTLEGVEKELYRAFTFRDEGAFVIALVRKGATVKVPAHTIGGNYPNLRQIAVLIH